MSNTLDRDKTCECIKTMCQKKGVTIIDIVKRMNVSRQTVYSWFSSKKIPSIDHLIELSDILSVTVDELMVRKGFMDDEDNL